MKSFIKISNALLFTVMISMLLTACEYEVKELTSKPVASFTVTPIAGQVNRYVLTNTSQNSFRQDWDKGTGIYASGRQMDTVYFPDAGTYTVDYWFMDKMEWIVPKQILL